MTQQTKMRKHERMALDVVASVSDGWVETPAVGLDASVAGLGLKSAFLWAPGTRVTVRLKLADATTAVAVAVVKRAEGDVMGLQVLATGQAFSRIFAQLSAAA